MITVNSERWMVTEHKHTLHMYRILHPGFCITFIGLHCFYHFLFLFLSIVRPIFSVLWTEGKLKVINRDETWSIEHNNQILCCIFILQFIFSLSILTLNVFSWIYWNFETNNKPIVRTRMEKRESCDFKVYCVKTLNIVCLWILLERCESIVCRLQSSVLKRKWIHMWRKVKGKRTRKSRKT